MKMINVSEAALDSIQRMGEADKARIEVLKAALLDAADTFGLCGMFGSAEAYRDIARVSTDLQPIAKSEN